VIWEKGIHRGTTEGDITLKGKVVFEGDAIDQVPAHEITRKGLIHCPERRRPFREMTVIENLYAGAYLVKEKSQVQKTLANVYQLFPRLEERTNQISGTLSGGEQQMLAIGRALMSRPELLLLDEPSLGLAPKMVEKIFETILEINKSGVTIFLVEQNAHMALTISGTGYVMETGRVVLTDKASALLENEQVKKAYLGE
jgi:branched-chain amino acid transport system ATP-binding protein